MKKDRASDDRKPCRTPDSVLVQRILGTTPLPSPEEEAETTFNSIMSLIDEGAVEPPTCLDLPSVWVSSVVSSGRIVKCPKADEEAV